MDVALTSQLFILTQTYLSILGIKFKSYCNFKLFCYTWHLLFAAPEVFICLVISITLLLLYEVFVCLVISITLLLLYLLFAAPEVFICLVISITLLLLYLLFVSLLVLLCYCYICYLQHLKCSFV